MWKTSVWRLGSFAQAVIRPASRVPLDWKTSVWRLGLLRASGHFSSLERGRHRFGDWAPSRKRSSDLPHGCTPARPMWPRPPGSLPLDGARGLGGDVVDDAVDALDLVDDPARDPAQQVVGQPRPVGGHGIETR